ncbi:hypothetical protein K466DRAFT_586796 [Polyporus arcularius HHB13444]|uniref:Uncharacterized protein n=1 Tax=Polyporus arcularius HHB13444 TaxID=1314778 RepID=A0A5C3PLS6_9APHY|nr:hypothetical protein K466DRAFT_586796 [Polyporus arcularius HHB13444]
MPPRRPPSDIFVTGRPSRSEGYALTPRTPHSRAGRAEEGFTELELETYQDDEGKDYRNEQAQPLLSGGYRSRGDEQDVRTRDSDARLVKSWAQSALSHAPLISGTILAMTLFALIVVSVTRPGTLEAALLSSDTVAEVLEKVTSASDPAVSSHAPAPVPSQSTTLDDMPARTHISYENYTHFPLTGNEYRDECYKMTKFMHHGDYWDEPHMGPGDVQHHDDSTDYHLPEGMPTKVCTSTITYMLDGHVGLTADLALMAQAAAFARERNRTFLVDDTHWNRGKWTDQFQNVRGLDPGPEPGCRAPPPEELVACPRTARHWVLSSRTAKFHMGHAFKEDYEDPYGHHMNRQKPIYERARASFEEVIRPNARTADLVRAAREEVVSILSQPKPPPTSSDEDRRTDSSLAKPALYLGVHIRRGDRVPSAYPFYPDKKIPLQKFIDGARTAWDKFYGNVSFSDSPSAPDFEDIGEQSDNDVSSGHDDHFPAPPLMWLASDSPPASREFVAAFPTATAVFSLAHSTKSELRGLAPVHEYVQAEFDRESLDERIRLTRGMIVDLAMLSGLWSWPGEVVPGAVVCGEGSNVCRIAALGLGFERAFGFDDEGDYYMGNPNPARARWVDVDIDGRIVPAWNAFEFH